MVDFDARDAVAKCLLRGEKILWCAKSNAAKAPQKLIRALKIPFLIWEGFAILFICVGFLEPKNVFGTIGTIFMLAGLYIMFSIYRTDKLRYKNLIYGITDQRVFMAVMEKDGRYTLETKAKLQLIQSASMACKEDGVGDIIFNLKVCKSDYNMDPEAASMVDYHKQPPDDGSDMYADRYCTIVYPFEVVSDRVYGADPPVSIEFLNIDSCKDVFTVFKGVNPDFVESKPPIN